MFTFKRHPENPIVTAGQYPWRKCVVFNPAVIRDDDGTFYMLDRAVPQLEPFYSSFGLLKSSDGVHFSLVGKKPVWTPDMLGFPYGSMQDPRLVKIDGLFHLVYVLRRYAWNLYPTGLGAPRNSQQKDKIPKGDANASRSGIAVSKDMRKWTHKEWVGPIDLDDRDNILFPEKIGGRYAMLRRPLHYVGRKYGTKVPSMWLSYSDDMKTWTEPELLAVPEQDWEVMKIGGSAPPVKTKHGWLASYHGVDKHNAYYVGFMLLDLRNPMKILARSKKPMMKPETYYERFGLVIPNTIFATANVEVDGVLYLYYGCCDTAIALATAPVKDILSELK